MRPRALIRHERPGDVGVAPALAARVGRDLSAPPAARVTRDTEESPRVFAALVVEGLAVVVVEHEPAGALAVVAHFERHDFFRPRGPLALGYQGDEAAVSDEEGDSGSRGRDLDGLPFAREA